MTQILELEPKYELGSPPKDYNKKKAIGVFACRRSDFGCFEILRAKIIKDGVVILPMVSTEGGADFHLTHHKNKFHWATNKPKEHFEALYGEKDYQRAFQFLLFAKDPPCICLRRGGGKKLK